AGRKVQSARANARQGVIFGAADVEHAVGGDDGVARGAAGAGKFEVMIRTDLLKALRQGVAQVSASGDGAKTGLTRNEAARGAGVDQLPHLSLVIGPRL